MKTKQLTIMLVLTFLTSICPAAERPLTSTTKTTTAENGSTTRTTVYSRGDKTILKRTELIRRGEDKPTLVLFSPLQDGKKLLESASHKGKRSLTLSSEIPKDTEVMILPSEPEEEILVQSLSGDFPILEVFKLKLDGTIVALSATELESAKHRIYAEGGHPLAKN
jgi:hypothetical protein